MITFYNENDPRAVAWLRELIAAGLIADGIVDERSITEIQPNDLDGFSQCHFFAGIGGWSRALKLCGVDDYESIWTGSCPCQPYSVGNRANGGAKGQGDCRDLWPDFYRLIRECSPPVVFGEQVESAISWGWWDRAALDFERSAYSAGAAVLRAEAYRAAHERKRLYWVAYAECQGRERHQPFQFLSHREKTPLPIAGDPLADARRALAGDFSDLLPCDGLSLQLERDALKGYGNAIVPQVAAAFIEAAMSARDELSPRGEAAGLGFEVPAT